MERTKICEECGERQIFVSGYRRQDGTEVEPYFRHRSETLCTGATAEESRQHKKAKRLIVSFLNDGGQLSVVKICCHCKCKHHYLHEYSLPQGVIAKEEVPYGKSYLDTACCVIKTGEVKLCIEVKYTHATTNTKDRDKIQWYEVAAIEAIDKIQSCKEGEVILTDVRRYECKQKTCEREYNLGEYASVLGYARKMEQNIFLDEYKSACSGIKEETFLFSLRPDVFASDVEWNKFIKLKRCLLCHKHQQKVGKGKPYCYKCFQLVDRKEEKEMYYRKDFQTKLSQRESVHFLAKYDWLRTLPRADFCLCGKSSSIWWFSEESGEEGYNRHFCSECFITECEQRYKQ